jgi:isopentenyldiphosphate isomerase
VNANPAASDPIAVNRDEIMSTRWVRPTALEAEISAGSVHFTPWFLLEWRHIWRDHRAVLPG